AESATLADVALKCSEAGAKDGGANRRTRADVVLGRHGGLECDRSGPYRSPVPIGTGDARSCPTRVAPRHLSMSAAVDQFAAAANRGAVSVQRARPPSASIGDYRPTESLVFEGALALT